MFINVVLWILVGALAGVLATRLRLGTEAGIVGNVLAGVIGSLIGGIVTVAILASAPGGPDVTSTVIGFLAAMALLWLLRALDLGEHNARRIER